MEMFGESGVDKTTIRQIASRAGVSPGLVIHHFGSKNGLREAVDDWIMEKINTEKGWFRSGGFQIQMDVSGDGERAAVMRYLIQMMRMDGPIAERLFDRMCEFTDHMISDGIEAGRVWEPQDRAATVATLVAYSMGASMFGRHVARQLGGQELAERGAFERYGLAALELFTRGFFTDHTFLDAARAAAFPPDSARTQDDPSRDRDH